MGDRIRISINGRFLTQELSGMQRYSEQMISSIDSILEHNADVRDNYQFEVLCPKGRRRAVQWKNIAIREVGISSGHLWEQIDLALAARRSLLINLQSSGPFFHARSLLVLHDAAVFAHPEHFSTKYGRFHRFLRPKLCRRAIARVTITDFSRRELAKFCKVDADSFTILGDSAEHILQLASDQSIVSRSGLEAGRYALFVGNQSPNKNAALAIEAFCQANLTGWKLALVGGASARVFGKVGEATGTNVVRLGRVNDAQLKALYENAGMFLFPSRYEGFGVPPLEAMSLGCPVVSSNSSAMPEVLGDAACFFSIDDKQEFIRAIVEVASDETLRGALKQRGDARAKMYSWTKSGEGLLSLVKQITKLPEAADRAMQIDG